MKKLPIFILGLVVAGVLTSTVASASTIFPFAQTHGGPVGTSVNNTVTSSTSLQSQTPVSNTSFVSVNSEVVKESAAKISSKKKYNTKELTQEVILLQTQVMLLEARLSALESR